MNFTLTKRQAEFLRWLLERHIANTEEAHEKLACKQIFAKLDKAKDQKK